MNENNIRGGYRIYCLMHFFILFAVLVKAQGLFSPRILHAQLKESTAVQSKVTLLADQVKDQDDLCIWVHPADRGSSTIITSDKEAGRIFVYDLEGQLLQEIPVEKPGNIDIRQGVKLHGKPIDLVAVNNRHGDFSLVVFQVDPKTRKLARIDTGISTGPNYGGCLFHSRKSGKLYFICTSKPGMIQQYELTVSGKNRVKGEMVRQWKIGKSEGAVADDARGLLYIGEEEKGVWMLSAEPDSPTPGELVVRVGENGITGDIEGLALMQQESGKSTLIVSDQGTSRFLLFECNKDHKYLGNFKIEGAKNTDGIEFMSGRFGPQFPAGLFGCHTDTDRCAILLSSWKDIAEHLKQSVGSNDINSK